MIGEIVSLSALVLTNAGISIGVYKYFNGRVEKNSTDQDKKFNRVYERFDEHKKETGEKYVLKDMCGVMHKTNAENLVGLETRLNDRLDKADLKIESNFKTLFDHITKLTTK
jgi:hypothetical protein